MNAYVLISALSAIVLPIIATIESVTASEPPPPEEVQVQVTVQTPDSEPISNAPLFLIAKFQVVFALTNEQGLADFSVLRSADEDNFVVSLTMGLGMPGPIPPELRTTAIERYNELRDEFAFAGLYYIPLQGEAPYFVTIHPAEAVKISGRLVDHQSDPLIGGVGAELTISHDLVSDSGEFTVSVAKGQDAIIWYTAGNSPQDHRLVVPAILLQSDFNLGDIAVTNAPLDATVSITTTNNENLVLKDKANLAFDVSLIERTTLDVFVFDVNPSTGKVRKIVPEEGSATDLRIASGDFFVVPGNLFSIPRRALYYSLVEGRQEQLETAGVPLISLQPGQNDPITIDAKAALEAVMQVGGDLVDD